MQPNSGLSGRVVSFFSCGNPKTTASLVKTLKAAYGGQFRNNSTATSHDKKAFLDDKIKGMIDTKTARSSRAGGNGKTPSDVVKDLSLELKKLTNSADAEFKTLALEVLDSLTNSGAVVQGGSIGPAAPYSYNGTAAARPRFDLGQHEFASKSPIEQFTALTAYYETRPDEALNFASDLLQLTAKHLLKNDFEVPILRSQPTSEEKADFISGVSYYLEAHVDSTPSLQGALAIIISDCLSERPGVDVADNCKLVEGFVSSPTTKLRIDSGIQTEFENPLLPAEPVERSKAQRTESLFNADGNLNLAHKQFGEMTPEVLLRSLNSKFRERDNYDLQGQIVIGLNMSLTNDKPVDAVAEGLKILSSMVSNMRDFSKTGVDNTVFKRAFENAVAEIKREAADLGHPL